MRVNCIYCTSSRERSLFSFLSCIACTFLPVIVGKLHSLPILLLHSHHTLDRYTVQMRGKINKDKETRKEIYKVSAADVVYVVVVAMVAVICAAILPPTNTQQTHEKKS